MKRNRRAGVADRWTKTVRDEHGNTQTVPSARHGKGLRWLARYVDERGREHSKAFTRKTDAHQWLDRQTAAVQRGEHVAPRDATLTVQAWCDLWITGYGQRESSVSQARVHIRRICDEFGDMLLAELRPSLVKSWVKSMQDEGLADSYVHRTYNRLNQILADAMNDGVLGRNPCSRRTSPPMGKPKVYVATTEQVWAIHDAVPDHLKVAVLLGAFAGLRVAEVSGLRVSDVDFMRGVVFPKQQWGGGPLKTDGSSQPIPIPKDLALLLSASVRRYGTDMMVTNGAGQPCGPWVIKLAVAAAREKVPGLPEGFSFHDLRHYLASLLIASGADIKTVQAHLRHSKAATTLDTYGHLWPDADESTKAAVGKVITERLRAAAAD